MFDKFFENRYIRTKISLVRASTILSSIRRSAWLPEIPLKLIAGRTEAPQKDLRSRQTSIGCPGWAGGTWRFWFCVWCNGPQVMYSEEDERTVLTYLGISKYGKLWHQKYQSVVGGEWYRERMEWGGGGRGARDRGRGGETWSDKGVWFVVALVVEELVVV